VSSVQRWLWKFGKGAARASRTQAVALLPEGESTWNSSREHTLPPALPPGNHVRPGKTVLLVREWRQGDSGHNRSCQPLAISSQLTATLPVHLPATQHA
jgi:hypothetical protein